jgi:hypothetical protein
VGSGQRIRKTEELPLSGFSYAFEAYRIFDLPCDEHREDDNEAERGAGPGDGIDGADGRQGVKYPGEDSQRPTRSTHRLAMMTIMDQME